MANKSQSINKIKTRTTTIIGRTASVQYKGHGTQAMEPESPYKASALKKSITNVSKRSLRNYEPNYWYRYLPNYQIIKT